MRNYGIACGDDFFCRGEQRSPVDLTLLRHTGATFGRPLVFCPFFISLPLNNLYTMYLHKNAVPTSRQNGVIIILLPLFPQPAVFQAR